MITKRARRSKKIPTIFTIGHSTRPITEFLALLQEVGVDLLVDVRSIPRSRTNPQFNADALPGPLGDAGIRYRHLSALGGLRHRQKGSPTSLNKFWHVATFRTMPITRQRTLSEQDWTSCEHSPATIAARSCVPKRYGGVATAASLSTIFWLKAFRSCTSWGAVRSIPRSLRPARMCWPTGRSYTRPGKRRSKQKTERAPARAGRMRSSSFGRPDMGTRGRPMS